MPTLLDYRRRIRSVKSTKQITRAMKFVAAAKLRRAQEGVFAARPYAKEILRVLRSAAARMESPAHPLLKNPRIIIFGKVAIFREVLITVMSHKTKKGLLEVRSCDRKPVNQAGPNRGGH